MIIFGFEYSRFEGLTTPWFGFDKWLCKLFGHPARDYYLSTGGQVCARCCNPRGHS